MTSTAGVTVQDCVSAAAIRLIDAGWPPDEGRRDAVLLARFVLGWDQARWLTDGRTESPADFAGRLAALVSRRAAHEPVAYILGAREFYGRRFVVSPDVLIPRPDTEAVIETARACLDGLSRPRPLVVDVGTGCGCLAVTLAVERPDARVVATDVSAAALAVARQNAERLAGPGRVECRQGSLLAGLRDQPDLIVSNPPYVREDERPALPREVLEFEPAGALFAGADGLDVIRQLVAAAAARLTPGGWLVTEIGFDQGDAVRALVETEPSLSFVRIARDLESRPRVVVARRA